MPGRPANKVLPPSSVSFSKTRREKDEGEGVQKEMSDDRKKIETKTVYANTHPMLTRDAVKWHHSDVQDVQVAVTRVAKSEMDNSENVVTLDGYAKLNNIIKRTYCCVVNKKKKKKLLHKTGKAHPQAHYEDLDTYKYSDYPESGISPNQHAPQAATGPQAAAAAAAARTPAEPIAGVFLLLAPAAAVPVHPAAPPEPIPAAAAAFPANVADFAPPTEWQVLSPLPPPPLNDPDDSFGNKFFDFDEPESDDNQAASSGEDHF